MALVGVVGQLDVVGTMLGVQGHAYRAGNQV